MNRMTLAVIAILVTSGTAFAQGSPQAGPSGTTTPTSGSPGPNNPNGPAAQTPPGSNSGSPMVGTPDSERAVGAGPNAPSVTPAEKGALKKNAP